MIRVTRSSNASYLTTQQWSTVGLARTLAGTGAIAATATVVCWDAPECVAPSSLLFAVSYVALEKAGDRI